MRPPPSYASLRVRTRSPTSEWRAKYLACLGIALVLLFLTLAFASKRPGLHGTTTTSIRFKDALVTGEQSGDEPTGDAHAHVVASESSGSAGEPSGDVHTWTETMAIPSRMAEEEDEYLCTGMKLPLAKQTIKAFVPNANKEYVHHMILYGCDTLGPSADQDKISQVYKCKEGLGQVCKGLPKMMYAWANGAEPFNIDEDAGFVVGSHFGTSQLILQVHFLEPDANAMGMLRLDFTSTLPSSVLTMMLFAHSRFMLPKGRKEVNVATGCCVPGRGTLDLYAHRVHAHAFSRRINLRSNASHVVLDGDPQKPHNFNKVAEGAKPLALRRSTHWNVTCSYNTQKATKNVYVGMGHENEMCNMYLMLSSQVPVNAICEASTMVMLDARTLGKASKAERVDTIQEIIPGGLGQVAGIHMGYGGKRENLLIFHRARREMGMLDHKDAIQEDVMVVWDTKAKRVVRTFGGGTARLPHGLTIDGDGGIWTTDVDDQTARRLGPQGDDVLLTVGVEGTRGHDAEHLCRPTEVAVASTGEFYVADGYCNARGESIALRSPHSINR